MIPLIRYVEGLSPIDVMASVTAVYLFMLIFSECELQGRSLISRGYDAATQSEQALSTEKVRRETLGINGGSAFYKVDPKTCQRIENRIDGSTHTIKHDDFRRAAYR